MLGWRRDSGELLQLTSMPSEAIPVVSTRLC
jgi:hypothetical protein